MKWGCELLKKAKHAHAGQLRWAFLHVACACTLPGRQERSPTLEPNALATSFAPMPAGRAQMRAKGCLSGACLKLEQLNTLAAALAIKTGPQASAGAQRARLAGQQHAAHSP